MPVTRRLQHDWAEETRGNSVKWQSTDARPRGEEIGEEISSLPSLFGLQANITIFNSVDPIFINSIDWQISPEALFPGLCVLRPFFLSSACSISPVLPHCVYSIMIGVFCARRQPDANESISGPPTKTPRFHHDRIELKREKVGDEKKSVEIRVTATQPRRGGISGI